MSIDVIIAKDKGAICMGDARAAVEAIPHFDVVVLCAEEFQPTREMIRNGKRRVALVYAPIDDAELSEKELMIATRAADIVAEMFEQGKQVLVTCMAGRNRSGLVVALALHMLSGAGGVAARRIVRERRTSADGPALSNPSFNALLDNIPARAPPTLRLAGGPR